VLVPRKLARTIERGLSKLQLAERRDVAGGGATPGTALAPVSSFHEATNG
jgi:hypothetical protein